MVNNPFILYGYESEEYFCDRQEETKQLLRLIENGNNVALIAPRRIGKTGLIENLYHLKKVQKNYYTFLIDIYATKNMEDMVMAMGSTMLASLRPKGTQMMQKFAGFLSSLRSGISFDPAGNPSWNVEIGDIRTPSTTIEEIFHDYGEPWFRAYEKNTLKDFQKMDNVIIATGGGVIKDKTNKSLMDGKCIYLRVP